MLKCPKCSNEMEVVDVVLGEFFKLECVECHAIVEHCEKGEPTQERARV